MSREEQAESRRPVAQSHNAWRWNEPTPKQLKMLERLGYQGEVPKSRGKASDLIAECEMRSKSIGDYEMRSKLTREHKEGARKALDHIKATASPDRWYMSVDLLPIAERFDTCAVAIISDPRYHRLIEHEGLGYDFRWRVRG